MTLVLHEQRETSIANAVHESGKLWLAAADIARATGWELKPEGLCRGEICLPLRPGQRADIVRGGGDDERIDLAGLWRGFGHPVASDAAGDTWVLGTSAGERTQALQSLDAPDFTLPDLAGRRHTLSDYRGRKVFLATWASW